MFMSEERVRATQGAMRHAGQLEVACALREDAKLNNNVLSSRTQFS